MAEASIGSRLQIAILGRRNAGKSSVLNALSGQEAALVSEMPGTTVEPLYVPVELDPLGPVMLIDTSGLDDDSEQAELRRNKLREVLDQTDLALLLFIDVGENYGVEHIWYRELVSRQIPVVGVINRMDDRYVDVQPIKLQFDDIPLVKISAKNKTNLNRLREAMRRCRPLEFARPSIAGNLLKPNDLVVMIAPTEISLPAGRLPYPHAPMIRDVLDHHACTLVLTIDELTANPDWLAFKRPALVVADSDTFAAANRIVPQDVPLTTYSLLMAKQKGDLELLLAGVRAIDRLKPGDRVLMAEVCGHRDLRGDCNQDTLPSLLEERTQGTLQFDRKTGGEFPYDLSGYKLVLQCGSCALNRKQLMSRLAKTEQVNVPVTQYGLAMAYLNGSLDRVASAIR